MQEIDPNVISAKEKLSNTDNYIFLKKFFRSRDDNRTKNPFSITTSNRFNSLNEAMRKDSEVVVVGNNEPENQSSRIHGGKSTVQHTTHNDNLKNIKQANINLFLHIHLTKATLQHLTLMKPRKLVIRDILSTKR